MKTVVSVSLGSSKRDMVREVELLGETFRIERRGTDGSREAFKKLVEELDGQVDALGIGGADLWVVSGTKRYTFREVAGLIKGVKQTPIVDGSGLKHTLERQAIHFLQDKQVINFQNERVLLVSAVDRFGMAQAQDQVCPNVVYGDLLFGLGLPIPVRSYRTVQVLAAILLPIVTQLPIQWFYPTGEKQETRSPQHPKVFNEATFICGDWHYIRRFAPDRLDGKTILTQTVRPADIDWLRSAGVKRLITTTPQIEGGSFATNVMEGVIVALLGRPASQITEQDYLDMLARLDWSPGVLEL